MPRAPNYAPKLIFRGIGVVADQMTGKWACRHVKWNLVKNRTRQITQHANKYLYPSNIRYISAFIS